MTIERQQQDLDLWKEWHKTNDPKPLNQLMDRLNPLIQREVQKWGGTVPVPALESKARVLALDALKTYNPNRGAAVGTHVASRIRKISRHVYPYQNVARLPENKQLLYNTFQIASNKLLDDLGREPNVDELADELSWSQRKVTDFQRTFGRRELVESEGGFMEGHDDKSGLVDFYYHGLMPKDKTLFEDITGYSGRTAMSNSAIIKKHKMTQGQLSYKKQQFVKQLSKIQKGEV